MNTNSTSLCFCWIITASTVVFRTLSLRIWPGNWVYQKWFLACVLGSLRNRDNDYQQDMKKGMWRSKKSLGNGRLFANWEVTEETIRFQWQGIWWLPGRPSVWFSTRVLQHRMWWLGYSLDDSRSDFLREQICLEQIWVTAPQRAGQTADRPPVPTCGQSAVAAGARWRWGPHDAECGHCLSLSSSEDSCESDRSEDVPVEKLVEKTKQWVWKESQEKQECDGRESPWWRGVGGDSGSNLQGSPGDGTCHISALSQLGAFHSWTWSLVKGWPDAWLPISSGAGKLDSGDPSSGRGKVHCWRESPPDTSTPEWSKGPRLGGSEHQ